MKNKLKQYRNKVLIVILAVIIMSSIPNVSRALSILEEQFNIIKGVYELISENHISDIDSEALTQGAIKGMLDTLEDPYTTYFTEKEFNSFLADINGSFTGIGIYIEEKNGYIVVQAPIPGSPADKVGLKSGDALINVDGVNIVGKTTEEAASLIRGEEGTIVILTIKRNNQNIVKEIKRAKIYLPVVESEMLSDDIGYLRLYTFSNQAILEFNNRLNQLKNNSMEKFILDLRGNPGGYLDAVLDISKNFISEGPIVYIKHKNQQEKVLSIQDGSGWDIPMVVLIDSGSASASEILAGALKDYSIATIIGENSFGKGTVQSLIPLENGGYLKLTINEYFTPNKHKVNGLGIKPDIEVLDEDNQISEALNYLTDDNKYIPELGGEWIQKTGKDYVGIRSLINSLGGKIYWNPITKEIEVELNGIFTQFAKNNSTGLIFIDGRSYIEIQQLMERLPGLIILNNGENLTIFQP